MLISIFGIPVKYEKWNKANSLSLYITASYKFQATIIDTQQLAPLYFYSDKRSLYMMKATEKNSIDRRILE